MDLIALCESLKARAHDVAAAVVHRWGEIAESESWLRLPEGLDFDHLPTLIRELAGASLCTEYDRKLCEAVVESAARHGERRVEQGFGENLVYREYHLLRRALAREVKSVQGESAEVYYAIMRLDALMSIAQAAALHGVYRDDLAEHGRWPDVLDKILEDWPLPVR